MRVLIRRKDSRSWEFAEPIGARAETQLQELLAESPSLIPVDQIREGVSPLLVAVRELGLPGSGNTDVIAVTADGDIALIECKLAVNAESKRKVIGQILEYAAFLWEMSYEELDGRVQQRRGKPLARLVEEAVAGEWDEGSFRAGVEQSLASGAFLLVIVVDAINEELRRIVRYVNECGRADYSLHALELRLFRTEGLDLLVPHLHGVAAAPPASQGKRHKWTEEEFLAELARQVSPKELALAQDLYRWGRETADRMFLGTGSQLGSVSFHYLPPEHTASVFTLYSDGNLSINYRFMVDKFDSALLVALHERLREIPSFAELPADFMRLPSLRLAKALPDADALARFKQVVEQFRDRLFETG